MKLWCTVIELMLLPEGIWKSAVSDATVYLILIRYVRQNSLAPHCEFMWSTTWWMSRFYNDSIYCWSGGRSSSVKSSHTAF